MWIGFRVADQPSSIGTGRRELGSVELGCQDRGWLAAYLRLNDMSIWGRCCQSRVPLRRIFCWVNRYDRQKRTRKSMPEPTGWLGRLVLRNMNSRHSKVTDWGLSHASI